MYPKTPLLPTSSGSFASSFFFIDSVIMTRLDKLVFAVFCALAFILNQANIYDFKDSP